jgi:hypothetical protein
MKADVKALSTVDINPSAGKDAIGHNTLLAWTFGGQSNPSLLR